MLPLNNRLTLAFVTKSASEIIQTMSLRRATFKMEAITQLKTCSMCLIKKRYVYAVDGRKTVQYSKHISQCILEKINLRAETVDIHSVCFTNLKGGDFSTFLLCLCTLNG